MWDDDDPILEHAAFDDPELKESVLAQLRTVFDPEIPVNIVDLGLIYEIRMLDLHRVVIIMTLTTPNCPVAESFPFVIQERIKQLPGIDEVFVEIVWDPPWDKEKMSDSAKLALGLL